MCAETVKDKTTGNDSGFITHSNKIYFAVIWLDTSVYLITQWKNLQKTGCLMVQKIGYNKKSPQVWEIVTKYNILTVEEKK